MGTMKTPGVYILEKNAFPNSVVEVATAVPAFIGYTEKAENKGNTLLNKPWRITSMAEFHQYFGGDPTPAHVRFKLTKLAAGAAPAGDPDKPLSRRDAVPLKVKDDAYVIEQNRGLYLLYSSMRLFFQNGGGPCYIVSVGTFSSDEGVQIDGGKIGKGLEELTKENEPTMVVIPEAVLLKKSECDALQVAALMHCGQVMKNRVAILDIWEGYEERNSMPDCVAGFRNSVGINNLAYGAAYYPWIRTAIVQERDLSYANIDEGSFDVLKTCIKTELTAAAGKIEDKDVAAKARLQARLDEVDKIGTVTDESDVALLAKTLTTLSPFFNAILGEMAKRLNLLPPSPAMAGIYTMVDNSRGVWKAPANVSLNSVVAPAVPISSEQQEDLNVTPQGKSINAIRSFIGEGTLVWGARTLDGNSLDWRYINVRRTMIMLEESIRLAAKAMVFEPNVSSTWTTMRAMISNFLTGIWKRGGLAGAVPEDAFSVHVGLGETMTPEDILEGILRVTVLVAISRPAEFIEITFQQQMQKS